MSTMTHECVTRESILEKVIGLAAEQVGMDPRELDAETHLIDDLGFDSLDIVEFIMKIEEEFEINIPDEKAQDVRTIGQATEMLIEMLGAS